ncbi:MULTISPECIES: LysE family translocator [Vibrio]|uniref:LysE family translocator n=1 Tax=Vibrio tasmaniensis TaxID=212663 RepID=A0A2N7NBG3_9VIBR|nr:LysE family translocator [Vibrio tasmaniensis]PMP08047.1 threonine transporter RhtB [Vibrio tasmaniensis]TKG36672.1 LysE family translocator [Vibrio tasmaniensis]TKG38786.1 LysE family translocator [Vibrio tasmaniensis]TKG47175.1 LysE family translocator [Vibrio tasmaniensis]TKG51852.1 LysE family translocator [Vibrio tasmaniensis]
MSITSGIALFVAMLLSAAIPGPSVLAVLSRSLSLGWKQGLLVVLGVLIADYIFIFLALSGLSALASAMGEFATVIKYVGVAYLFWLAYTTWTSDVSESSSTSSEQGMKASSVIIGLLMTVSNPKAILFYMGFFPAFIDLKTFTTTDVMMILVISTVAVGGVLSLYACTASKARFVFQGRSAKMLLNRLSGGFLATCGALLATKT